MSAPQSSMFGPVAASPEGLGMSARERATRYLDALPMSPAMMGMMNPARIIADLVRNLEAEDEREAERHTQADQRYRMLCDELESAKSVIDDIGDTVGGYHGRRDLVESVEALVSLRDHVEAIVVAVTPRPPKPAPVAAEQQAVAP